MQRAWGGRIDDARGDGRARLARARLTAAIADVIERTADQLSRRRATLDRLRAPGCRAACRGRRRAACRTRSCTAISAGQCPRGRRPAPMTLLDWGDSGIGQPLLDLPAFLDRTPAAEVPAIRSHWEAAWRPPFPAPSRVGQRDSWPPWPPHARPSCTGGSSTTSSRPSGPTTPAIRRTGWAERRSSSTRSARAAHRRQTGRVSTHSHYP